MDDRYEAHCLADPLCYDALSGSEQLLRLSMDLAAGTAGVLLGPGAALHDEPVPPPMLHAPALRGSARGERCGPAFLPHPPNPSSRRSAPHPTAPTPASRWGSPAREGGERTWHRWTCKAGSWRPGSAAAVSPWRCAAEPPAPRVPRAHAALPDEPLHEPTVSARHRTPPVYPQDGTRGPLAGARPRETFEGMRNLAPRKGRWTRRHCSTCKAWSCPRRWNAVSTAVTVTAVAAASSALLLR